MPSLDQLVTAIAAVLGAEWHTEENAGVRGVSLVHADGLRLWCHIADRRLHISPESVPMLTDTGYATTYHYDRPVITVDPHRPPQRVVADIHRRLLPVAGPWHADAHTKALLTADMHQRQQENLAQLLALPHTQRSQMVDNRIYGVDWRADVTSTMVSLHFTSLSLEMALHLLRLHSGSDPTAPEVSDVPTR